MKKLNRIKIDVESPVAKEITIFYKGKELSSRVILVEMEVVDFSWDKDEGIQELLEDLKKTDEN